MKDGGYRGGKTAHSAFKATGLGPHAHAVPPGTGARGSQSSCCSCCRLWPLPFLALPDSYCPFTQARSPPAICPVEEGTLLQSQGVWEGAAGAEEWTSASSGWLATNPNHQDACSHPEHAPKPFTPQGEEACEGSRAWTTEPILQRKKRRQYGPSSSVLCLPTMPQNAPRTQYQVSTPPPSPQHSRKPVAQTAEALGRGDSRSPLGGSLWEAGQGGGAPTDQWVGPTTCSFPTPPQLPAGR